MISIQKLYNKLILTSQNKLAQLSTVNEIL